MNELLLLFEKNTCLKAVQAAKLLGIPSPTYYQYRRTGQMPLSVRRQVEVMMRISEDLLHELISEHVYDGL